MVDSLVEVMQEHITGAYLSQRDHCIHIRIHGMMKQAHRMHANVVCTYPMPTLSIMHACIGQQHSDGRSNDI